MSYKVLHINSYFIGTKLHRVMIKHLDKLDVCSDVFVPTARKNINFSEFSENIYISKCFNKYDRLSYKYKQNKIYQELISRFDLQKYDMVHAYTVFADGYSALKLYKQFGKKYVVAVRDTDLNVFFKYFIHLRKIGIEILNNASMIFFLSDTYKETLLKKYIPTELHEDIRRKSITVPNGIDDFWHDNEYKAQRKITDNVRIICVGRINTRKNIIKLQKAINILNRKGIKVSLKLVGPVDNEILFRVVKKNKYTDYHAPVEKEELISFYRDSDIFVLASYRETFGLVYAEALSQGLPVVYTEGQGFDKQFEDGYVGFPTIARSAKHIAYTIEKVIKSYNKLLDNTVVSSKKYNWDSIVRQYFNIYSNIVN